MTTCTKTGIVAVGLLMVLGSLWGNRAQASLFGADGLDPAFCEIKTFRQTVIYVDDMMMTEGKVEWARAIFAKLKASLMPGERVTIVRLSPGKAHAAEIDHACWPDYPEEQRAELAKGTYVFSTNPLEAIGDQQKFFGAKIDNALTKIWTDAKRSEEQVQIDQAKPPEKQILRALASDEGRFTNSPQTIRAIVYSDMMENSDLGSVFRPLPEQAVNYGEKLGSHFHKGVFYAFGVAEDVTGGQSIQENSKLFWTTAMKYMTATLSGFGADLNIPNRIPVKEVEYALNLDFKDHQELYGQLSLLTDKDGNLIDSWALISRLGIAPLDGTFRCSGDACKLDGTPGLGIVTTSHSEVINLSGSLSQLEGKIGVQGDETAFPLKATSVK